jgi:hypothetical protein
MQNFTVHLGSATPLSYRAGPRAPAPPRSRCHRGPPGRRQCAVVRTATRRRHASHPGRGRPGHGRGQAPRRRPAPRGTSTTGPPLSFPSLSTASTIAPLKRDRAHSSSSLHSSHPDRRLRPPAAHSPLVDSGRASPPSATPR